jgi:hypothetical protein
MFGILANLLGQQVQEDPAGLLQLAAAAQAQQQPPTVQAQAPMMQTMTPSQPAGGMTPPDVPPVQFDQPIPMPPSRPDFASMPAPSAQPVSGVGFNVNVQGDTGRPLVAGSTPWSFGNMFSMQGNSPWVAENRDMLMSMGLGLMGGRTAQDGFQNAMMGYQRGALMDRTRTDKSKLSAAYAGLAQRLGLPPGLMEADPDLARSLVLSSLTKGQNYDIKEVNGRLVAVNPRNLDVRDVTPQGMPNGVRLASPAEEQAAGWDRTKFGPLYFGADGKPIAPQRGGVQVNVETKTETELAKGEAQDINDLAKGYPVAQQNRIRIRELTQRLSDPDFVTGNGAAMKAWMRNNFGIALGDNVSKIEMVQSLINQLLPSMRQGLPGAASDRDMTIFQGALPALVGTPEGNRMIASVLGGLAELDVKARELALRRRRRPGTPGAIGQDEYDQELAKLYERNVIDEFAKEFGIDKATGKLLQKDGAPTSSTAPGPQGSQTPGMNPRQMGAAIETYMRDPTRGAALQEAARRLKASPTPENIQELDRRTGIPGLGQYILRGGM